MGKELTTGELEAMDTFLTDVRSGTGPLNAGIAVGWSPAQVRRLMKDPDFAQLVDDSREQLHESIESTLYRIAEAGNIKAIQMVLYNKRSDEWKDVRHIEVQRNETLEVGVVLSVKQAAVEMLREGGVAALQSPIDVESTES